MRSHPRLISQALAGSTVVVLVAGCSLLDDRQPERVSPASPVSPTRSAPTPSRTAQAAAPGTQVSPGGVTTAVNAPASSTEDEYYDACHFARVWMAERQAKQGGQPQSQVEPYLAMVQASPTGAPGTWHTPWSQLTPQRQSAVIVAVTAAANGECD